MGKNRGGPAMSVLLEFSMSPLGKGESVSKFVARSLDIIDKGGTPYRVNPMGTVLEGEWDEVFAVVKKCFERMKKDCPRVTASIKLDYSESQPVLAVRLQEMFGLADTPRIAGGKLPIKLHLLSPARRPVQVTQDLANFWRSTYQEVKKDLNGRYPKHWWPDDPMEAEPTARAKPRGS